MNISGLIIPKFHPLAWHSMRSGSYTDYWLMGGRGSGKSSAVSILMAAGIAADPQANAIIFRKVGDTLRTSVFEKIKWADGMLGIYDFFRFSTSPLEAAYLPTGQKMLFRGLDDSMKLKSIDLARGYFRFAWFEELAEFRGMEEVMQAILSIRRGGSRYSYFYTYNPPKRVNTWVNLEAAVRKPGRMTVSSTYLDVPPQWLGDAFLAEAEHLKKASPEEYRHVFLVEATGTGGTVFPNAKAMKMTDDQISRFDKVRCGIDWGYAADPFAFVQCCYDRTRRRLFIFGEIYRLNLLNDKAMPLIKERLGQDSRHQRITADSEEPESISEFRHNGLNVSGAKKGKGSVEYGIKWLQSLEAICIDPDRCPNAWREFSSYELEKDRLGEWKSEMPDKNNHAIDAVRYACTIPAEDAARPGWENRLAETAAGPESGTDAADIPAKVKELALQRYGLMQALIRHARNMKIFGVSYLLPVFERGYDYSKPYSPDGIQAGSFKGFKVIDPYWAMPQWGRQSMSDPASMEFYEPAYYALPGGVRIHATQILKAANAEVPDILKPSYYFGGIPLTQMIYERVYAAEKAEKVANEAPLMALTKRTSVLYTNLDEVLSRPETTAKNLATITRFRDNQGIMLQDLEARYEQHDISLADFDALISTQYQLVAAVAKMPAEKLFKTPISGLGQTGAYAEHDYKQELQSLQERVYMPAVNRANEIIMRSDLERTEAITAAFNPVDMPTEKEKAEIQEIKARINTSYLNAGVITPEEARDALR